jgi:hypothetical protein
MLTIQSHLFYNPQGIDYDVQEGFYYHDFQVHNNYVSWKDKVR